MKIDSKYFLLIILARFDFFFFFLNLSLKDKSARLLLTQAYLYVSRLLRLLDGIEE